MSGGLDGLVERADDILVGEAEFSILVRPAVEVLSECFTSYSERVPIDKFVLE